jgi:hypothetical protein
MSSRVLDMRCVVVPARGMLMKKRGKRTSAKEFDKRNELKK